MSGNADSTTGRLKKDIFGTYTYSKSHDHFDIYASLILLNILMIAIECLFVSPILIFHKSFNRVQSVLSLALLF